MMLLGENNKNGDSKKSGRNDGRMIERNLMSQKNNNKNHPNQPEPLMRKNHLNQAYLTNYSP